MTPRKLSDSDKQTLLDLYRTTAETCSTLANRFGVSTSTVSRILKTSLSETEYEGLIQQKRGRTPMVAVVEPTVVEPVVVAASVPAQLEMPLVEAEAPKRSRKRVVPTPTPSFDESPAIATSEYPALELADLTPVADMVDRTLVVHGKLDYDSPTEELEEILADELIHHSDLETNDDDDLDDFGDDDDDDDEDDDDFEDDGAEGSLPLLATSGLRAGAAVQVLPLTSAPLPRTCYFVVDRSAELVARPLSDFGDLGQIPTSETQEKTLPLFDNHRVAKRFSNPRTQRVIKLPDSRVLQKTMSHLQAKGITRLLIDGRVYALVDEVEAVDETPLDS